MCNANRGVELLSGGDADKTFVGHRPCFLLNSMRRSRGATQRAADPPWCPATNEIRLIRGAEPSHGHSRCIEADGAGMLQANTRTMRLTVHRRHAAHPRHSDRQIWRPRHRGPGTRGAFPGHFRGPTGTPGAVLSPKNVVGRGAPRGRFAPYARSFNELRRCSRPAGVGIPSTEGSRSAP